jgi:hypothetical protein
MKKMKSKIIIGILFFIPSCQSEDVDTEVLLALAMPRPVETRTIVSEPVIESDPIIELEPDTIIEDDPKFPPGYIYFLDKNENILYSEIYDSSRIQDYNLLLDLMENDPRCPCKVLALPNA